MDLSIGPDENLYVGTHGRGIWRIGLPAGSFTAPRSAAAPMGSGPAGGSTDPSQGVGQGKGKKPSTSPGRAKK
jgi:hypothetical protein